jgi:PKD repeat protein
MIIRARTISPSGPAALLLSFIAFVLALTGCASGTSHISGGPTPPSAPANVAAVAGNTKISLSWTASTATLGVAAYLVERCQGASCSTFTQVASISGTTTGYTDSGLAPNAVYTYRVRAQDTAGSLSSYSNTASATTNSTVSAPVITSAPTASATVGAVFSYQIAASNSPTNFGATPLPAGLSVNTATGVISGTPAAAGTFPINLSASNSSGTGTATLTLTVAAAPVPPAITSSLTANATVGTPFSYQITASNSPTSFAAVGLPAGLAINQTTGLISGTPNAAGTSNVTIGATNPAGTGSATLTLTVTTTPTAPAITSAPSAKGTVGIAFSYQIVANNSPTSFAATGLPVGLSVDTATGLISGNPTVAGTSNVALSATNAAGTGTAALALTISNAAPVISSSTTATATVGAAFSYQIIASNSPTGFAASGLPAGLSVNATTGLISGTPTTAGNSTVSLSATNSGGTGTATLTLTVSVAAPVITSSTTATATVGTAFSYQIAASNSPTSFAASGLPAGLTVNTTSGLISGTPTAAGTSTVTLSATNKTGTGTATLTLTVSVAAPVITSGGTASATAGTAFSYQIAASNSPTSFGASGLPAGLTVNTTSGLISGTPTAAGTSTVTLSATNKTGTGTATLTLTVSGTAPVITSSTTASGTVGSAFSYQITASNSPTSFAASGLPAGLTVNTTSGLISGTPTASGTSSVTLSATNSSGTGNASLTLTISGGSTGPVAFHSVQISNDADDGYYNHLNTTWNVSSPNLVGSWSSVTTAYSTGYRFPAVDANSGDTIQLAYLKLVSSATSATSSACGGPPCSNTYTFRVYGVAQDDGASFSSASGNTPLDVPYTSSYTDYTTTGPGDAHGSCKGNNNGQNTCTHTIDVTNIVKEITSRPGWKNTSAMRFVLLSTDSKAPNVYAGFADYSANASKAATLVVNPPEPTIVSSGAYGTSASVTYPTSYSVGPFVYHGASTLLLFLGDYYNFYSQPIPQPTISDSCGNRWYVLAGPTNWAGAVYFMRSTVYYVQNPASCPAGDTITVSTTIQEPIFLHFVAVAGSDTSNAPIASAITSPAPGVYTTSAASNSISLTKSGLLISWIFGDSDAPHVFTPQSPFVTDLNSTPNYLTTVFANASSAGSYQSQFAISPSDGWQAVIVGLEAP